jgi:hypothetical protein
VLLSSYTTIYEHRRVWRYRRGNLNPYIEEEQKTQRPKEKVQKDKQRSTQHTHKTKDRVFVIYWKYTIILYILVHMILFLKQDYRSLFGAQISFYVMPLVLSSKNWHPISIDIDKEDSDEKTMFVLPARVFSSNVT